MTNSRIASIAAATLFAVSASLTGLAHADTGLTRAQVLAELAEAQNTGNVRDVETGVTLQAPSARTVAAAKVQTPSTRATVTQAPVVDTMNMTVFDAIAMRNPRTVVSTSQR
jgi:hypothetical protein